MGLIAVNENKASGRYLLAGILKFQGKPAAYDIHQKEAVIAVPAQGIAAFIDKMAGIEGIKKHLLRREAGRIGIIFGCRADAVFTGFQGNTSISASNYNLRPEKFNSKKSEEKTVKIQWNTPFFIY